MPEIYNFNKLPVIRQWPFPLAEAADIVLAHLDTQTKAAVVMTSRENLKLFRTTIGQWIIDSFGMRHACEKPEADQAWIAILEYARDRLREGDPE